MFSFSLFKSMLLERAVLPLADFISGQNVMEYYHFFDESQWWSPEDLYAYQMKSLKNLLRISSEEVPFYQEYFKRYGVNVESIKNRSDLSQIPPVRKKDLRQAYPDKCVRKTQYPFQEFHTSGSTGIPFVARLDVPTLSEARALMLLRAKFSGWSFGESMLQTGMSLQRGQTKRLKDLLLSVKYVSAFDLSDIKLDQYLNVIDKKKLCFVMGYPVSIYFLAQRAQEVGFNRKLKGIVCWGDNLYEHYRRTIEQAFGCKITDTYGCGEGIQVAAQCQMGSYHVFMPHVIVEIVDENGLSVAPGATGSVLLTRLSPGPMPLIRYYVGDIAKKSSNGRCSCRRSLETFEAIEGRDTDIIVTPRGNRLIVHFFTGIFEYYTSIETFKVTQEEVDRIHVEIVPKADFTPKHWEMIKKEILEKGDPNLEISMSLVDDIPYEASNKRRFVVSKI